MSSVKRQITTGRRYATGERGLVAAVMAQAYVDALDGDAGARDYFAGPVYKHHLGWLGLPGDWKPELL